MTTILDRQFLEAELSKLEYNRYNKFQWWRRYKSREPLSKKAPLYDKIINGDYDYSSYLYQAEHEMYLMEDKLNAVKHPDDKHEIRSLFMERYRRLILDYEKEESAVMRQLKSDFVSTFKIKRHELEEIMENFNGTLIELYNYIKQNKSDT
jgi:hypothetical protein